VSRNRQPERGDHAEWRRILERPVLQQTVDPAELYEGVTHRLNKAIMSAESSAPVSCVPMK
jgi:hypothetical protein